MIAKLYNLRTHSFIAKFHHTTRKDAISFENGIDKEIKCELA